MLTQETLVAKNILGQGGNGVSGGINGGIGGGVNGNVSIPTPTSQNINQDVHLFGQKPTWSAVVGDPAATVGPAWQNEVLDSLNGDNVHNDQLLNAQLGALLAQQ